MGAAQDVTVPIHQFIDGFNTATRSPPMPLMRLATSPLWTSSLRTAGSAACAAGVAADYDKHAQATGVSDGIVKYGAPTRTEIEGDAAYVIVPTTYLYKERASRRLRKGR